MATGRALVTIYLIELRRSLTLWWSYRLDALSSVALWLIAFPLIILMFDSVSGGYDSDRREASLIGFLVWNLCAGLLASATANIVDEAREGTLENVLTSAPAPLTIFSLRVAAIFTRHLMETAVLGLVLVIIMRLPIPINMPAFLIIFLTVLAVGGLSLALGGLALVFKNTASLVGVVTLLALFFTGAILPLDSLGTTFTVLKYLLPTTWGIDALRAVLVNGMTWTTLWETGTLLGLTIQAVAFLLLGRAIFNWGFRRAQKQGSLGSY